MLNVLYELTLQKGLHNFMTNTRKCVLDKKVKVKQQHNQKILTRARNRIRDLSHRNPMRYFLTTNTAEHIDCSFNIMG